MKVHKIVVCLGWLALTLIFSGCHHKIAPAPPVSEAPNIIAPAPTATLTASPEAIDRGGSLELAWSTQNATTVTIDGIGIVSASGSQRVTPESSTTYHLTASGEGGSAEASARVTVNVPETRIPEPTDEELFAANVRDIFFDFDSHDVRPDQTQTAESDAAFLAKHPNITLVIEGHCDERGSEEYNLGLGESRASTVRDRIVELGVSADRIRVMSFGKEKPFCATAEDESCWSQNRRAHFVYETQQHASR
jgi:peptidoglycan-associated lipoprotein